MRRAVGIARTLRCLPTWGERMRAGLLHAWKLAKAEARALKTEETARAAKYDKLTVSPSPREAIRFNPVRRSAEAVRSWSRPVRVHTHGW